MMGRRIALAVCAAGLACAPGSAGKARADLVEEHSPSFADVISQVQPKIVKIYGAGGYRGLESYQSGLITSASGEILTVWSYVLDTDFISVTLDDGRRFPARLVAYDPRLELAVLKIEVEELPFFELARHSPAVLGTRVLAFSNLFGVATGDEPVSVQHGTVAALTQLDARRGAFDTPYRGQAYVVDAMTNNPGAAGGALTDRQGRLLGMLGKELRDARTGIWLNYALPAGELVTTVEEIRQGRFQPRAPENAPPRPRYPQSTDLLGLVLVPNVLDRTPPFVDAVRASSAAEKAGLAPDDLVVFVNGNLVQTCDALVDELSYIDRADPTKLTVIRGQELLEVTLRVDGLSAPAVTEAPR